MNEFKKMLEEAFLGEEPYDLHPSRAELESALRKFEQRDRTMRRMLWFAVVFMAAVAVASAWTFLEAGADDAKRLIFCATLFLWANVGVGWAKMFLFQTQQHLTVLKELKRVHLAVLEEE